MKKKQKPIDPRSVAAPLPPFIFELRNAIREGRKTMNRRVAKHQPPRQNPNPPLQANEIPK